MSALTGDHLPRSGHAQVSAVRQTPTAQAGTRREQRHRVAGAVRQARCAPGAPG